MVYVKNLALLFSTFLVVLLGIGFGNYAEAATQDTTDLSPEEVKLSEIVTPHIQLDEDTGNLVILNEQALEKKLKDNKLTNITTIKQDLENANNQISKNQESNDGITTYSACSNAIASLGLAHVTSLSAAAIVLGVTAPWLVFGIVTAYGIVWTGAGFACP